VALWVKTPGATSYAKVATNTGGASPGSFMYTPTAGSGAYSFYTLATDKAGNVEAPPASADATTSYGLDTTPPTSKAASPTYSAATTLTVTYTASDNTGGSGLASVELWAEAPGATSFTKVSTHTGSAGSGSFSYAATAGDGSYAFYTIAVDAAGNRQATPTAPQTRTLLDTTPPSSFTLATPAAYLAGTVQLSISTTPTDGGSGIASITYQYQASGQTTWSTACSATKSPYSCSWTTSGTSDGQYGLRALAADKAGNTTVASNAPLTAIVENTRPAASSITTTNAAGGTRGVAGTGDTVTFTYTQQINPASILSGWSGASTAVQVHISTGRSASLTVWKSSGSAELPVTNPLALGGTYAGSSAAVFSATMVQNGASITLTLGSLTSGSVSSTPVVGGTLKWTPSSSATNMAGRTCTTTSVSAAGPAF
jgi:hypothetical protein